MSQWTHVIGSIQCCWSKKEALEKLGKPVLWDDCEKLGIKYGTPEFEDYSENVWRKAFKDNEKGEGIPMGSEGSIDWYFVNTANEDALGEGTLIAIQGDLRDFGGKKDIQVIINWFEKATEHARFATLTIKDDDSPKYITLISDWGEFIITEEEQQNV